MKNNNRLNETKESPLRNLYYILALSSLPAAVTAYYCYQVDKQIKAQLAGYTEDYSPVVYPYEPGLDSAPSLEDVGRHVTAVQGRIGNAARMAKEPFLDGNITAILDLDGVSCSKPEEANLRFSHRTESGHTSNTWEKTYRILCEGNNFEANYFWNPNTMKMVRASVTKFAENYPPTTFARNSEGCEYSINNYHPGKQNTNVNVIDLGCDGTAEAIEYHNRDSSITDPKTRAPLAYGVDRIVYNAETQEFN